MKFRLSQLTLAVTSALLAQQLAAQTSPTRGDDTRGQPLTAQTAGAAQGSAVQPVPLTLANSRIAQIRILPQADSIIADGNNQLRVKIEIFGTDGKPLADEVTLTLEATHGLINLKPGAPLGLVTDKQGRLVSEAEAADLDELTPGLQIKATGSVEISVVAPFELKDIELRVTGGAAQHSVTIKALPELRDMIAAGVIEGQIRLNNLAKNLVPANEGDLFERELRRYSHEFSGGKGSAGARAAFFLKGKIKGEYLLTAAADSEKENSKRLFKDIDPNTFYPVYGDSSLRGQDAQSSSRLYVRVDKERSYALYGDYTSSTSSDIFQLGNFSRATTGLKWHFENANNSVSSNAYAAYTSQTQVVDEIPGRGISGPYSVSNPNGVAGSERVEILVRDRNQTRIILKATSLIRSSDYEFEPFSGKILFKAPVPSVDENFNPVSIRISYEVDAGGEKSWMGGLNAEWQALAGLRLGAAFARDNNPTQDYGVASLGLKAQLAAGLRLTAEVVRTDGTPGGVVGDKTGHAQRLTLDAQQGDLTAQLKWLHSDKGFDNPSAGLNAGRREINAQARYKIDSASSVLAQVQRSQDEIVSSQRDSASVEYERQFSQAWGFKIGMRHAKDATGIANGGTALGSSAGICSGGAGYNGGFGIASNSTSGASDTLCQNGTRFPVAPGSLAAATPGVQSDSLYARVNYQPPSEQKDAGGSPLAPRWTLFGEAEIDTRDSDKHRYGLGANYQIAERTKLYARAEQISSATGINGLNTSSEQTSFTLGASSDYAENAQVYNEYRLSSATTGRNAENALGLRNALILTPGLKLSTSAEFIKVFSGTGSDATALGIGLDYTGSPVWKASGRVEWRQDNAAQNWLSTAKVSRKLDADWTLLAQNYLSITENRPGAGRKFEDRFIIGSAYRPVETNEFNSLMRYEHRSERDSLPSSTQPKRKVDIVSLHGDWHPQRVWHINGRFAVKRVNESFVSGTNVINDSFSAYLLGARAMYDLSDRWSVGVMASALKQTRPGSAMQFGYGLEAGYAVTSNLWFNVGYTWRGLNDKDLLSSEYRNRGLFFGLRYKFDENLFNANNPRVNKSLEAQ
jgi:hypothetical protein